METGDGIGRGGCECSERTQSSDPPRTGLSPPDWVAGWCNYKSGVSEAIRGVCLSIKSKSILGSAIMKSVM